MPGTGPAARPPTRAAIELAVAALRDGRAIVLPTDTVYGVAVLPSVPGATQTLFALKARTATDAIAVLVADVAQARLLAEPLPPAAERLMAEFWPGPLTLVVRRRADLAGLDLGGTRRTIGLRCPDHDVVRKLADRLGPLAATSANRHGDPTPTTAEAAAGALTGPVAVVLDGGMLAGPASAVVDCTLDPPRVLRPGALGDRLRIWAGDEG